MFPEVFRKAPHRQGVKSGRNEGPFRGVTEADASGLALRWIILNFSIGSMFQVNEQGTTAAGTTVAAHATRAKFVKFQANEPFIFLIRDSRTNLILFAGKVSRL